MPPPKHIVRLTAKEHTELETLTGGGRRAMAIILQVRILLEAEAGSWDCGTWQPPASLSTHSLSFLIINGRANQVTHKHQ